MACQQVNIEDLLGGLTSEKTAAVTAHGCAASRRTSHGCADAQALCVGGGGGRGWMA
jgi:hypothetical protein